MSSTPSAPAVLFSLADEAGDEHEHVTPLNEEDAWTASPPPTARTPSPLPSARFGIGLKSTISSREAHFDADPDDLEPEDVRNLPAPSPPPPQSTEADEREANEASAQPARTRSPGHRGATAGQHSTTSAIDIPLLLNESLARVGDSVPLPDWLRRGSGTFDGTVNMANSILGAGIVGLPYSMRESGFVAGVALLVGLSFLTDWTIRLIVLNAKLSGRRTYIEIMQHCFGPRGSAAVSLFQFAFAFGGMCAFCVVIGDTIPAVLGAVSSSAKDGAWWANRGFVISFCTIVISFPLSLYRNIESLSKASAIALVSMVVIIASVIVRGPMMPAELKGDPHLRLTIVYPTKLIRSIAVISFAFVCHHNSLLIYGSLKEPSMDKFGKVTHYSTLIAGIAATTMSVAGYWSFEEKTLANVLNNFPADDTFVNVARFLFGVNMFTTFPLECFVCREVLETYFWPDETAALAASAESGGEETYNRRRHYILTSALVLSSLIISLLTCDLGIVLELTGGLSATALAYIFPSACFLKLSSDASSRTRAPRPAHHDGDEEEPLYVASGSREGYHPMPSEEPRPTSEGIDDLERTHGPAEEHDSSDVDPNEIELPLKPGAAYRVHDSLDQSLLPPPVQDPMPAPAPAGIGSGGVQVSGATVARPRKTWTHTKLLAVGTAVFGMVVLAVSVATALSDVFTGRTGERHTC